MMFFGHLLCKFTEVTLCNNIKMNKYNKLREVSQIAQHNTETLLARNYKLENIVFTVSSCLLFLHQLCSCLGL